MDRTPIAISPHVAENIDRVLVAIRTYLEMDVAFVTEFLGPDRIFRAVDRSAAGGVQVGDVVPMTVGYCGHVVAGRLPELIPDTRAVPRALDIPETRTVPIGAHLSVPIRLDDGRVFGTFCCISHQPRPRLDHRHLGLMRTFGAMIASELRIDLKEDGDRRATVRRLRAAVEAGDPGIVFQPYVRLSDLCQAGVEALSRFASEPKRAPDVWFADAQAVGLGAELELLAVRKALAEARELPPGLSLNVNISPQTLVTADVSGALAAFDPRRLVVEITEHVPIEDYAPVVAALEPLRERGVRIAIDDAGAGYSSLRHVLALRPDIIKFDVSLTRRINRDPARQAMVAALCEFARRTSTQVVAEGVETAEELAVLRELGVEKAQGYFFGRPLPLPTLLAA